MRIDFTPDARSVFSGKMEICEFHRRRLPFCCARWSRGAACIRLLDECFDAWAAHRVMARCDVRNPASWRLLERLGFRREGHLLANASFHDDADGHPVWKDTYLYALLDREWAGRGERPA